MIHTPNFNSDKANNFSEKYEITVWKLILRNCDKEQRADGENAYVVKDLQGFALDIIEFINKQKDEK